MTVFDPSPCPDFNRVKRVTMRSIDVQFGDGYSQRAADGLNGVARTFQLTWSKLTAAQAQTIEDFFLAAEGYIAFDWAGSRDAVTRKYIVRNYQRNELAVPGFDTMTATLEQVFDL